MAGTLWFPTRRQSSFTGRKRQDLCLQTSCGVMKSLSVLMFILQAPRFFTTGCYRRRVLDPDHCVPRATSTEMQTQHQHKPVKGIHQLWLHPLEATAETLAENDFAKMDGVSNSSNVVDISSLFECPRRHAEVT